MNRFIGLFSGDTTAASLATTPARRWALVASLLIPTALVLASCQTAYDPLVDYEELQPATAVEVPSAAESSTADPASISRGRYLVALLGCGTCHTHGALIGYPDKKRLLSGSSVGIAYTNPFEGVPPGIVFPANLTPDAETGLGRWSRDDIATAITHGRDPYGIRQISVMPWQNYAELSAADVDAIASYLMSLAPVHHPVPQNVPRGVRSKLPFVHFGVYRPRDQR